MQNSFHLVSYADQNMTLAQKRLCQSYNLQHTALSKKGVMPRAPLSYSEQLWNASYLDGVFFRENKKILTAARGAGFWLWKPYVIKKVLDLAFMDDIVMYCDAGIEIRGDISGLLDLNEQILLFANEWRHIDWCKRSVLASMLPNWWNPENQQAQASVILIRKNAFTVEFVNEWLLWCQLPHFIDDEPSRVENTPEFREHRHDQAILTNLAIRNGVKLHWWPAHYNYDNQKKYNGDDYPYMFYHHRLRNNEWKE